MQLSATDDELLKAIDTLQRTAARAMAHSKSYAAESVLQKPAVHHQTAGTAVLD
jgi:hypothetical protein